MNTTSSRRFLAVLLCGLCACSGELAPSSSTCGNGVIDPGESCDDGNGVLTDACPDGPSGSCQPAVCGDGVTHARVEACDDGPLNSDVISDACRVGCSLPICGDGVVDLLEFCDDGNGIVTDACPDGAQGTCLLPTCGDGFLQDGEECDDGADNSDTEPGACRTSCLSAHCGDGALDAGESCDDGNGSVNDACPDGPHGSCQPALCGDGFIRSDITDPAQVAFEECDDGPANDDSTPNACRTPCLLPTCGDGILDNNTEECDGGSLNSDSSPNACRTSCALAGCGDGVIDANDACDLGIVNRNRYPVRLAEGPGGELFVSDANAGSVFIYNSELRVIAELKDLTLPLGVAVSPSGRLYVGSNADDNVAIYSTSGEHLGSFGDGMLIMPNDIALDADGNIYVVDSLLRRVVVFGPDGTHLRDIGTPDNDNGSLLDDELRFPMAISVTYRSGHPEGEVFVVDQAHYRVVVFSLEGIALRTMGSRLTHVDDTQGKFAKAQSVAIDSHGRMHVADAQTSIIQILDADSGAYIGEYGGLGAKIGQLNLPLDIWITSDNRVAVANNQNHRVDVVFTIP